MYMQALRSSDLDLQTKAYFNRGNALVEIAKQTGGQGKLEDAIKDLEEAGVMYENAMLLSPEDRDPKINYELALGLKEQLEEQLRQMQQMQQQGQEGEEGQEGDQGKEGQSGQNQEQGTEQAPEGVEQEEQEGAGDEDGGQYEQISSSGEEAVPEDGEAERMTPEEAVLLLEAMKEEEQAHREMIRRKFGEDIPVEKDW